MWLTRGRPAIVAVAIWLMSAAAPADEFADGLAAFDRGDLAAAHERLLALAEAGDARAAIVVAGDFYVGWGVPADDVKADEWRLRAKATASSPDFDVVIGRWRSMAGAGDAAAQAMLGAAYYDGFGLPMATAEAVKWIRAAADHGHPRGQYALGALYFAGDGVPKDISEAIRWFRLAADQGDASAQLRLGVLTERGVVTGHDVVSAAEWYGKAAEQGNVEAQRRLDKAYRDGQGRRPDDMQSLERYRLVAVRGSPLAQMRLGEIYLRGELVAQDSAAAYQWLVLASSAQDGLSSDQKRELQALVGWAEAWLTDTEERAALYSLGEKCRDGSGVPQDDVLAYRFMDRAMQGETDASRADRVRSARDQLAARMTPQDVAMAQATERNQARRATGQAGSTRPATAPAVATPGDDCLFVIVRPSLRTAVRVAADKDPPPRVIRFEGDPGAELCDRSMELTFSLVVDRSRQAKNWEDTGPSDDWWGTERPDAEDVALASLLPWPCPTTHTVSAVVRDRAGDQLASIEARLLEKRTGTMLRCADESGPSDAIATELVRKVLRKMMASAKSPAGVGGP
jgi:TPR repeat protein